MCYIVFISHSLHWRYIEIALEEYVINPYKMSIFCKMQIFPAKKVRIKIEASTTWRGRNSDVVFEASPSGKRPNICWEVKHGSGHIGVIY